MMKNKFWKNIFLNSKTQWKVSVMMPKHSPKVTGQIWEKVKDLNFWGPNPLGCIWMLYVCSGDMVCAVWTSYMSSGDGICCMDMLYAAIVWDLNPNINSFYSKFVLWAPPEVGSLGSLGGAALGGPFRVI